MGFFDLTAREGLLCLRMGYRHIAIWANGQAYNILCRGETMSALTQDEDLGKRNNGDRFNLVTRRWILPSV